MHIAILVPFTYVATSFCSSPIAKRNSNNEAIIDGICGEDCYFTFDLISGYIQITGNGNITEWNSESATPWYSYYSSITSLSINVGIKTIGTYSFTNWKHLQSIQYPVSITTTNAKMFDGCSSLSEINIIGSGPMQNHSSSNQPWYSR